MYYIIHNKKRVALCIKGHRFNLLTYVIHWDNMGHNLWVVCDNCLTEESVSYIKNKHKKRPLKSCHEIKFKNLLK